MKSTSRRRIKVKKHPRTLNSGREITVRRHSRKILRKNTRIKLRAAENRQELINNFYDMGDKKRISTLKWYGDEYLKDVGNPDKFENWDNVSSLLRNEIYVEPSKWREEVIEIMDHVDDKINKLEAPAKEAEAAAEAIKAKARVDVAIAVGTQQTVTPLMEEVYLIPWVDKKKELIAARDIALTKQDIRNLRANLEQYSNLEKGLSKSIQPIITKRDHKKMKKFHKDLIKFEKKLPEAQPVTTTPIIVTPATSTTSVGRGQIRGDCGRGVLGFCD